MKKLFYLVLLSFVVNKITLAQNESIPVTTANFTVGVPYAAEDLWLKFYFTQENEMMSVKIEKAKVVIQKFNTKNLTQTSINTIRKMPKGFILERMVEINKNYFLFYSIWDKENTTEQLFSQQIDWTSGAFKGEAKLVLKVKGKIRGTFTKYSNEEKVKSKFDFRKSYDESKLMIYYRKRPEEKKDALNYDIIGLFVFNNDMEEIWGDEVTMPYTEKKMDNIGYSVDKVGNAYILIRVYNDSIDDNTAKGITKFNNKIEILKLPTGSKNVKKNEIDKTPLDLENMFIQDIRMYDGPEDYMICTGFYTKEKNIENGARGIFYFKMGRDGGLIKIYQYDFPLAMINKFKIDSTLIYLKEQVENKVAYVPNLVFKKIHFGKDGSIVIFGEQYWWKNVSPNRDYVNYHYYYNGMVITKINANGELAFMKYLSKRQIGMNNGQGGMSAAYMFDEERKKHYLVYLDNLSNLKLKENDVADLFVDGKGGFLNAAVVSDDDGSVNKVSILNIKDAKGAKIAEFSVDRIYQTSPGTFGFEAKINKKEDIIIGVNMVK